MTSQSFPFDRFLGEFRELSHGRPDGPALRDSVRGHAAPDEDKLVGYLRSGSALAVTGSRVHDVLRQDSELIGALELHTDGEWFWYSDLAHYVERYHAALDEAFINHAHALDWTPPQLSAEDLIRIGETLDALFGAEDT
ncbi:hypothetical protein BX281_0261 [Streptomyces sp. Ag82_O1-15]|uniref:hypothetical protein n=1 Tax=Streptomyces sp. Ag82_O1-15 TaxID=1938855 RepID=UPI000BB15F65|nr:hypothetical protein [Streptomyces sp. Ag82_O1-15]PBC92584.1 hypothetical protein BX281_0261 [Streptomyces sp. Ag82_O1-15]